MNATRRAWLLAAGMAGASGAAWWAKQRASDGRKAEPPQLDRAIPRQFAAWGAAQDSPLVVNPQTKQLLDSLYSEIVTRTYLDATLYPVMLSVAYGNDQRGGLEAHKPEVCYPAQGFTLHDQVDQVLTTAHGPLPLRRLKTSLGARQEPVTYWFAMADALNASAFERRMVRLRTALTGAIPDGILLRVSSIDGDPARAWQKQDAFIQSLLDAVPAATRARLLGHAPV